MKLDGFDELNKKLVQISKNQAIQRNRFVAREAENLLSTQKTILLLLKLMAVLYVKVGKEHEQKKVLFMYIIIQIMLFM